jgi:hypothetical protein
MSLKDKLKALGAPTDDEVVIRETDAIWKFLKEARRKREYQWYIDEQYYDNNQTLQYNTATKRAQYNNADKSADKVVINKAFQQVRGVTNFLNAEHPSVGVRPGDNADTSYLRAKKERHLADYWYRHLNMNAEAKLVSMSAAKLGLGWMKILYNNDALAPTAPFTLADGSSEAFQYGEVMATWVDTWEIYPDPLSKDKSKMRYIAQAVVRTVAEIKANSLYMNRDKVTGDSQLAASRLRSTQIRQNIATAISSAGQPNGMDTVLTLEIFRKIYNPDTNKWDIWVTTRTEQGILLRNEKWNLDEFPYEYFNVEVSSTILGSRGIIHNIREPGRALNQLVTQVQESARIMGKLNWLMPRGSNVNVINDETGQFVEYDVTPGGAPRQAIPASLPPYIMQQIGMLGKFIEDLGGMHSSFNGSAPFAQASGDLVDKLSEGDQNSLTLMRDNYDNFFVRVFKLMLKTAKENYTGNREFPSTMQDAFGQSRWFSIKPDEISTNDDLAVSTGSQMPYSISQKQQMYMNLWKEKAIQDPETLFKLLALPELDASNGDNDNDIERQLSEIRNCIDTAKIPDPLLAENHSVHISTIDKFIRGDKYLDLPPPVQQALNDHRQKHIDFTIQLANIAAAQQVEPIKRSVTSMMRINSMNDTTPIERTQLMQRLGIISDAAEIQARGGLSIQDPAQAEMQAQNEDIEMMSTRSTEVSFADNHEIHLETHGQIINHPTFKTFPQAVQTLFLQHQKDHISAMKATASAPGLMPNQYSELPNPPSLNAPDVRGEPVSNNAQATNPMALQQQQLMQEEQARQQATQQAIAQASQQQQGMPGGLTASGAANPQPKQINRKKK